MLWSRVKRKSESSWRWKETGDKGTSINLRAEFSRAKREVKEIVLSLMCWKKTHFNLGCCNQWNHLSGTRTEQGQDKHRIKTCSDKQRQAFLHCKEPITINRDNYLQSRVEMDGEAIMNLNIRQSEKVESIDKILETSQNVEFIRRGTWNTALNILNEF